MSEETKCQTCLQDFRNCTCDQDKDQDDYDEVVRMLNEYEIEHESTQLEDGKIELELWEDDITLYLVFRKEQLELIEKYYTILSISPQLRNREGETFATLALILKWKGGEESNE